MADDPEVQRVRQNMEVISNVSYHGEKEKRREQEMARPAEQVEGEDHKTKNILNIYSLFLK